MPGSRDLAVHGAREGQEDLERTRSDVGPMGAEARSAGRIGGADLRSRPTQTLSSSPGLDITSLPTLLLPGEPQDGAPFTGKVGDEAVRWEGVVEEYERRAEVLGNDPRAALLFLEIGRIWEEHLAKPRNAAMAYQKAFNLDPKNPAILHASRRLFTEVGNWAMVVQILQYEYENTESKERRATLLAEKGTILEEKLRNQEEAQAAYREALEAWSAEPIAINALERLHQFRKEYRPLYDVYQRALEVAHQKPRRLPLLVAAAQLAEDRLGDLELAIRHYREILSVEEHNAIALAALRRLTLQTGRWEELVEILLASAASTQAPDEAGRYLLSASRVLHERLGRTEQSLLMMLKALEHVPEDLGTLKEIELLYEENQRFDEVVKVLRREAEVTTDVRERVPILFKLGSMLEDRLRLLDEAVPVFEEAVGLMPSYVPAKQALGRLYEKTGRWQALADLFEMEARIDDDVGVRVSKLLKLAEIEETKLGNADLAIKTLTELLALKADYQPARKHIERLLQEREDWSRLVALYEQELELSEDRDQKIFLLNRIGLFAEDRLQDLSVAWRAFERILGLVPHHLHAIRTLARLATKREAWSDLLRIYDLEVDATEDQKEVVGILHRAGVIIEEKLKDRAAAIVQYEKVLALNPTYLPALKSLGRLYHQEERWNDLLAMFSAELEVSRSTDQTVALLFRMADILVDRLNDDGRAAEVYHRVLQHEPENLPALRALSEIYTKAQDYERLIDVLMREAESLKDPKDRANTLMRVAETCETKLGQQDQAAEAYQEVLRLGYHFDPAIRALVRIYSAEGMWNALVRSLRTAYDHASEDDDRAAILVRCAEIFAEKLGNLEGAAESLEQALRFQPGNQTILSQLERISIARRDWRRAISMAERLAEQETDARLYAARQIRIAMMKETDLEPPESGAEQYLLALNQVPDHPVALRALEIAYLRAGNWEGLALFYQREALVTDDSGLKASLYHRAGDVAEYRLGNDQFAASMYEEALRLGPDHVPALRGRRRVAERLGDSRRVLESLERELALTPDPEQELELLFYVGRVHQDQLKSAEKAIETYEAVLKRSPSHLGAFNRLETLYLERSTWPEFKRLLELRAKSIEDVEEQCRLLVAAGQAAQDRMGDLRSARVLYEEVLSKDQMHPTALVRLGPICVHEEEWDLAIDVLHRTLAVNKEPEVQLDAFKSLGVIYEEHRQDLVKCVQSFQAALQIDPGDIESLRRLASVYRQAEDWTSAINVLLRLAEAEPSVKGKVETLLELGALYESVGDDASAILAHRKTMELDPANRAAVNRLTVLYDRIQDWKALAEVTAAFVQELPAERKDEAGPLHLKMADVFETKLHDDQRAINALRYALESQPDLEAALVRLAALYAKSAETYPQAIDAHRRLLRLDPFRVDSYHEMHQMFLRRREHDKAFVVAEILVFLRSQGQEEDLYYLEHKSKVASRTDAQLSEGDHDALVTHPDERGAVRAMLQMLASELGKGFEADLSQYELVRRDRFPAGAPNHVRQLADELARVLGAPAFDLWLTKAMDLGVVLANAVPPALIVGHNVARRMQDRDQRFLIGRELERLKGGHHILSLLGPEDAAKLVLAVARLAVPTAGGGDVAGVDLMQRRMLRAISGRLKKTLEERIARHLTSGVDMDRHIAASLHTANRAGLALTNDVEVAVRGVARSHPEVKPVFRDAAGASATIGRIPEVRELLAYSVSEEYFGVRAKLGFSIQS